MTTLLDLLLEIPRLGDREALRSCDGYRTRRLTYRQFHARIGGFVRWLDRQGFRKGDRLILYGENAPAWAVAFWACVARGVEVVPVDFQSTDRFVRRIQAEVHARCLLHGEAVSPDGVEIPRLTFDQVEALPPCDDFEAIPASPDDPVEIVYTSGTTGDPKGAVHRHRNLCANLGPLGREIAPYKKYLRPFQPLRILDLLPLSHMFGQSLGLFVPVLLGGAAVFTRELHPGAVIETVRRERVTVLVGVPRTLQNLRNEVLRRVPQPDPPAHAEGLRGMPGAAWRSRRLHADLGWKFWGFVVGGAQVDPDLEAFWSARGFLVVQGYGLTETSPVVAVNHPFRTRRGSLGKPLKGQEIRIAPDGEILVRGANVVSGYFGRDPASEAAFEDGWFHTGDLGEMDAEGHLYYRGRKKDVIVTPDGLNVHPQDVEAVLNRLPEVRESVVVPRAQTGGDRVHAALILTDPAADPDRLIRAANEALEPHQRIRTWSLWPEADFPRTPSTLKVRRQEVARRIAEGRGDPTENKGDLKDLLGHRAGRSPSDIREDSRIAEDLGLSSLERVDLLSELEDHYGVGLDEETFTALSTVGELKAWLEQKTNRPNPLSPFPAGEEVRSAKCEVRSENLHSTFDIRPFREGLGEGSMPRWSRSLPVRWTRRIAQRALMLPFFHIYVRTSAEGIEHLAGLQPPVLFAANHTSHFDAPVLLTALPARWRHHLHPAMAQEHFRAHFRPVGFSLRQRLSQTLQYLIAAGLFNAFPLPQAMGGVRRVLKYMGETVDRGGCPLVFPEGRRTPDGRLCTFRPGIGLMALRLRVPVIPVHISGLFEVLPPHLTWPRPGRVRVRIGAPVDLHGLEDYEEAARRVEAAVRALSNELR